MGPVEDCDLTVVIKGPDGEPQEVEVEPVGDGTFKIKYDEPNKMAPGKYVTGIEVDGTRIKKTPKYKIQPDDHDDDEQKISPEVSFFGFQGDAPCTPEQLKDI